MPKRDPTLLIQDMLTAIGRIERYIQGKDHAAFIQDEMVIDAVVRNLEVLGEAARQLPEEFTTKHPEVPWRLVSGLRNRIVHDYFGLDIEIIWQIISRDLQPLKFQLQSL